MDELDRMQAEARAVAMHVFDATRTVLVIAGVATWSLLWALVLLIGWGIGSQGTVLTGGLVLGGTAVLTAAGVARRRRRRRQAAERSVVARAQLERLRPGPEMEALLATFDVAEQRARAVLALPAFSGESDAAAALALARDHILELARTAGRLRTERRRIRRHGGLSATAAVAADTERALASTIAAADRIALGVRSVQERLHEVERLTTGPDLSGEAAARLQEARDTLDTLAAAYRELNALPEGRGR